MAVETNRDAEERRFAEIFAEFGAVSAYARRRGCPDPDAIAAEAMAIAWRRLSRVPSDDPRPWLFATARNLVYADRRSRLRQSDADPHQVGETLAARNDDPGLDQELEPAIAAALRGLSPNDREAILLIAWEELTPAEAAASLGIAVVAFRVRLHRARTRFQRALAAPASPRHSSLPNCPTSGMEEP